MTLLPRFALILAFPVFLASCAVVGYPAGAGSVPAGASPTAGTVSRPAAANPAPRPADAGRTYQVFGESYRVLDTAEGYEEEGAASWYGDEFHGRPTASGETYDMNGLSAAHRTLPLHTWVEVTNLDNGRRIVVRVNDRGPFARTHIRILDVSYGAARELDMVGAGTARVRVRALRADEVPNRR